MPYSIFCILVRKYYSNYYYVVCIPTQYIPRTNHGLPNAAP